MYTSELTLEKVDEFLKELEENEENHLVFGCYTKVQGRCVDLYYPAIKCEEKKFKFVEIIEEQNGMGWVMSVKIKKEGWASHTYHRDLALGVVISKQEIQKFLMKMVDIRLCGIYIKTTRPR
ncbi:hypothetical protein KJ828_02245 [Patescibacteria group bacterium]|nr:hypothetical protein [Patescibacteria group bacterium]MBU4115693.1 hypothetical protein [Patescibacteria group bacterium]